MSHFNFVEEPDSLVETLRNHRQLAIDTEFMREQTYYAQLCLTQIAGGEEIWCVDPLSGHPQEAFWQELLAHDWVLHSAGRRVLDRVRVLLDLDEEALAHARAVLRAYGNMSSATILFVLERALRREAVPGQWAVMVGLGPGFAAEGALLRW